MELKLKIIVFKQLISPSIDEKDIEYINDV